MEEIKISTPDGKVLHTCQWLVDEPKGWVQICHGMMEHASRYDRLARHLNAQGYSVFCHDMRGHGSTLEPFDTLGFVAERNGERILIEDVRAVARHYRESSPLPLYLLGHSMGALVACCTVQRYPDHTVGLFLSALPEFQTVLTYIGQGLAAGQIGLRGSKSHARLHNRLSFGVYNRKFKPNRTNFDWISSLDVEVDNYINDPMCGFMPTAQLFRDLLDFLQHAHDLSRWTSAHQGLQVFAFAGGDDPVAGMEVGFLKSMDRIKHVLPKLDFRVFPGSRHEVLWDRDSDKVLAALTSRLEDWQVHLTA